ncbi:hypothetical protein ACFL5T_01820 [Gemmatimonadota bacterium]
MTVFNYQKPIQMLVAVVDALPNAKVMAHKPLDARGHWSVLFKVDENPTGWATLKTISQAVTPTDGNNPRVDLRLLFVSEAGEAVFSLSPAYPGVDPAEIAASLKAHQALGFRKFGQGVLN